MAAQLSLISNPLLDTASPCVTKALNVPAPTKDAHWRRFPTTHHHVGSEPFFEFDGPVSLSQLSGLLAEEAAKTLLRAPIGSPSDTGDFLTAKLRHLPYEVFGCLYLDNRHRVLAFEELFRGTVDGSSVHPREVVRACLAHNACAVIFAHNHPSGVADPSAADRAITRELRDALQLVGVRVLDHLVIGCGTPVSMASRGLI